MADNTTLTVGAWAVARPSYGGEFRPDVWQIAAITEKLVKFVRYGTRLGQVPKDQVYAAFQTKEEAERMRDAIAGIGGERDRRVSAANKAAYDALKKLIAKARGETIA